MVIKMKRCKNCNVDEEYFDIVMTFKEIAGFIVISFVVCLTLMAIC
jgi:hypothetical protein